MDSNRIVGVELRDSNWNVMYIFGVYLPADGDIENYSYEIGLVESLYTYYSMYGNVIAGDMNSSWISKLNTNSRKSDIVTSFMNRCDICLPDCLIDGEQFTFITKKTMLDYILFNKTMTQMLLYYKVLEEGSVSLTSDHLSVLSSFKFECPYHYLLHSTSKLPAWHKASPMAIDAYRTYMLQDLNTFLARETH